MAYTTENFLASVNRQAFLPTGQVTFTSAELLLMGDEVIQRYLLPSLVTVREEFYVTYKDYSIVSGTAGYALPPRSIGAGAREIQLINSSNSVKNLTQISLGELHKYSPESGSPVAFYMRGDEIVLHPTPGSSGETLRVYYSVRPGDLVTVASAGIISAINTSTNVVTITSIPATWVTGDSFDFISKNGSHFYRHSGIDLTSTLVSGNDVTLPSLPSGLVVGDYVSISGQSPLIQLPPDLRPILAGLVAGESLLAMGMDTGKSLLQKAMEDLKNGLRLLTPRVVGATKYIMPDWS